MCLSLQIGPRVFAPRFELLKVGTSNVYGLLKQSFLIQYYDSILGERTKERMFSMSNSVCEEERGCKREKERGERERERGERERERGKRERERENGGERKMKKRERELYISTSLQVLRTLFAGQNPVRHFYGSFSFFASFLNKQDEK